MTNQITIFLEFMRFVIMTVTIKMTYTDAKVQLAIDNTASQVGFNSLFLSRETLSPDLYLGML